MKQALYLLVMAVMISSCRNRKIEANDIPVADTTTVSANADINLAFDPIDHYTVRPNVPLPDSIHFFNFTDLVEFGRIFEAERGHQPPSPDFVINFTVGIACQPTPRVTTIEMEKATISDSVMNVFVKIERSNEESMVMTPSRIFAIEGRSGLSRIDFFVNGKDAHTIQLIANPQ